MVTYKNPKTLLRAKKFDIISVDVSLDNGKVVQREVVSHKGAAVILPFLDNEKILLIRNSRYSISQTLLELPAGTLEENEDPKSCAFRELEEETGYKANKMEPLLSFYATPGFCNEKLFAFLAKDLTPSKQHLDESEKIEVVSTPFSEALEMIKNGTIIDAKSIATLLFYKSFKAR